MIGTLTGLAVVGTPVGPPLPWPWDVVPFYFTLLLDYGFLFFPPCLLASYFAIQVWREGQARDLRRVAAGVSVWYFFALFSSFTLERPWQCAVFLGLLAANCLAAAQKKRWLGPPALFLDMTLCFLICLLLQVRKAFGPVWMVGEPTPPERLAGPLWYFAILAAIAGGYWVWRRITARISLGDV